MKLVDISGGKNEYLKPKIDELETNRRIKISEICIGASMTLRRVTSLELIQWRTRRTICLHTPTEFWLGRGNISSAIQRA
jgi:hypothetical protein